MVTDEQPARWFLHAQTFERAGIMEIPGKEAHPTIVSFFNYTTLKTTKLALSDETPWCAAFVCAMLEQCGVPSTKSAGARSYLRWGVRLEHPRIGCVVVSERKDPNNKAAAHVAFYAGHINDKHYASLGGNQSNRVCTKSKPYSEVLAYCWPVGEILT